ncbi:imidazole glycerol phosphate synthase subunit HisH [Chloroflexota bacterium]
MIAIIDYGAGNLRSVVNAIAKVGYEATVTSDADTILNADVVVLPGVGAARDTMDSLAELGVDKVIHQVVASGKPFLAICIGLQVMFTATEEEGWHECLDIIPGVVKRLPEGRKIPHMGWNQLEQKVKHSIFDGIPDKTNFYFVHSYHGVPEDETVVAATTDYGISICAMVIKDNIVATQFHPEKSGEYGLKMYANYFKMALGGRE